jgi:hypothetical protein
LILFMPHALSHKIPSEIDDIYYPLFNQVSHLHVQWNIFRQLYVADPETFALLRWSANGFFGVVQQTLASEILLTISRLTDTKQTGSGKHARDNLSLDRLIDRIDEQQFPDLKDEMSKRLVAARQACAFARDVRNKLLAHSDLATNLRDRAAVASQTTTTNIDAALRSIAYVLNAIPGHFDNSGVAYAVASMSTDGTTLLNRLRAAKTYLESLADQLSAGGGT